jgi:hypothetical protein
MQWKHPTNLQLKKFKSQASAGKVILTLFFDIKTSLLLNVKLCNDTITASHCGQTLKKLYIKIKKDITVYALIASSCCKNIHPHVALQSSGPTEFHAIGDAETSCMDEIYALLGYHMASGQCIGPIFTGQESE